MDDSRDAFGHMLSDYVAGTSAFEIVERDDGFIGADSPAKYIAPYRDWPAHQQTALCYASGRVLGLHRRHRKDTALQKRRRLIGLSLGRGGTRATKATRVESRPASSRVCYRSPDR